MVPPPPQGGNRHLVTVPPGLGGNRRPLGGDGHGGGKVAEVSQINKVQAQNPKVHKTMSSIGVQKNSFRRVHHYNRKNMEMISALWSGIPCVHVPILRMWYW